MSRDELTTQEFRKFQEFIYDASGIRVDERKRTLLSNRVRRRLKAGGFGSFSAYYRHITSRAGREELGGFLDAITTNETCFFRTQKHFEWFRSEFIRDMILQRRAGSREPVLRVWSAACSTGEEPYSIAVCLAENRLRLRNWTLEVVGTDISAEALETARRAVYRERTFEHVSDVRRKRYFRPADDDCWEVRPESSRTRPFSDAQSNAAAACSVVRLCFHPQRPDLFRP